MIEYKTFGEEHNKERIKMEKTSGQLFNYFSNQKDADFLILYSCDINSNKDTKKDDKLFEVINMLGKNTRYSVFTRIKWNVEGQN